jgi:hypothetical protein
MLIFSTEDIWRAVGGSGKTGKNMIILHTPARSRKIKLPISHLGGAESLRRKALSGGGWLLGRSVMLGAIDLIS